VNYRDPSLDPTWGQTPHSIVLDSGGNVIVTGWVASTANGDALTIKYSKDGVQQWEARYQGPWGCPDGGSYVGVDASDNIYIAGTVTNTDTGTAYLNDFFLARYSPAGVEAWSRTLDGASHLDDTVRAAVVDRAGNFFVTGMGTFDFDTAVIDSLTARYDSAGTLQWAVAHNSPNRALLATPEEVPFAIALDAEGSVYTTAQVFNDPAAEAVGAVDIVTIKNVNQLK